MKPGGKPSLTPKLRFPEFRGAEGWTETHLRDVLIEHKLKSDTASEVHSVSVHKGVVNQKEFLGRSFAAADTSNYNLAQPYDIIYTKSPTGEFAFGVVKQNKLGYNVIVSPLYGVFEPANRYLGYILDAYFESPTRAKNYLAPITQKGAKNTIQITNDTFISKGLYIPRDEREQKRIAECLISVDDLIAAQTLKLDALKNHRNGLMRHLFPRDGETQPRLRFTEFQDAGEWEVKRLEELAKRGSGHTPSKTQSEYYNGGIKWVSLADSRLLDKGLISDTAIEISELGIENSSASIHPAGTVILSRDAGVGKSAIMNCPMAVSQHFIAWACDKDHLLNWFLYYLLQIMKPVFERVAAGSTIKTIGLPFFKALCVTVPLLPEQQRIADCLISLDNLIAAQTEKLDALKTHKRGLMQQFFPSPEEIEA